MTTPQDIIRAWCASCGMAEPSNGDCGALLSELFPAISVAQALGEVPAAIETDAQLAEAAQKGFEDYWAEDSKCIDSEAWLSSAKAVLALAAHREQETITRDQIKVAIMERRGKLGRAMTTDDFADAIFELIGGAA